MQWTVKRHRKKKKIPARTEFNFHVKSALRPLSYVNICTLPFVLLKHWHFVLKRHKFNLDHAVDMYSVGKATGCRKTVGLVLLRTVCAWQCHACWHGLTSTVQSILTQDSVSLLVPLWVQQRLIQCQLQHMLRRGIWVLTSGRLHCFRSVWKQFPIWHTQTPTHSRSETMKRHKTRRIHCKW